MKASGFIRVSTHSKTSETSVKTFQKDLGIEVPKTIETRLKFSMHADKDRG